MDGSRLPRPPTQGDETTNDDDGGNLFDRFMDVLLRRRPPQDPEATTEPEAAPEATASTDTTDTSNTSGDGEDPNIIVNVNYFFFDASDPNNPDRTGTLAFRLPSSRGQDPSTIQELVRIATQIAYLNFSNKRKGITLEKFNSFPIKAPLEVSGECSICFEEFEALKRHNEEPPAKRRRLHTTQPGDDEGEQSTQPAQPGEDEGEQSTQPRAQEGTPLGLPRAQEGTPRAQEDTPSTPGESAGSHGHHPSATRPPRPPPKFLADFRGEFAHVPTEMPCGHVFGKSCLFEWLKNQSTCPLCRASVAEPAATSERSEPPADGPPTRPQGPGLFRRFQLPNSRLLRFGTTSDQLRPHYHVMDPAHRLGGVPFQTFVASRRTPSGVHTVSGMGPQTRGNADLEQVAAATEDTLDYLHLRSLVDPEPGTDGTEEAGQTTTTEASQTTTTEGSQTQPTEGQLPQSS